VPRDKAPPMPLARATLVFGLLADENRLRLLRLLAREGEVAVLAMYQALGLSQSAVSHHLALLRAAGLVGYRREGQHNYYRITDPMVPELLRHVERA
jgi:ArsR family transcriptional regulator, arsenate/arsenite/antimonite-responsive transcriptional repressor